jgi:5-methylcytosine-specific restriction endonuclease McrA
MKQKPDKPCNGGKWTVARKNSFIMSALRRASYRWGPVHEARKASKIAYNTYVCAACKKTFGTKQIKIDHIEPVKDVTGKDNSWDSVIRRLFCEVDGFQVLCRGCHDLKTSMETAVRKLNKSKTK